MTKRNVINDQDEYDRFPIRVRPSTHEESTSHTLEIAGAPSPNNQQSTSQIPLLTSKMPSRYTLGALSIHFWYTLGVLLVYSQHPLDASPKDASDTTRSANNDAVRVHILLAVYE